MSSMEEKQMDLATLRKSKDLSQTQLAETISSSELIGKEALDIVSEKEETKTKEASKFTVMLAPLQAKAIVFKVPKT